MAITQTVTRAERPAQLRRFGSIFDLAKAAETRRGSKDLDSPLSSPTFASLKSRNNSINQIFVLPQSTKKQKFLTPPHQAPQFNRLTYESSNESFSPTLSEFSADENSSEWGYSDVSSPFSVTEDEYLTPKAQPVISEEEYHRNMHRAQALAALEGRTEPVADIEWEPLIRTSRSEYEDHVEAEHGQLQCLSPRPRRSHQKVQREINLWEETLEKMPPPPVFGLGISTERKRFGDELEDDWDVENSPPLEAGMTFSYKLGTSNDLMQEEEASLSELSARYGVYFGPDALQQVAVSVCA